MNDLVTSAGNAQVLYNGITGISQLPVSENGFELYAPYPNPVKENCSIGFFLPQHADVKLEVFNALGEKVARLENSALEAGDHHYSFSTKNLGAGIYFCTLKAGEHMLINKIQVAH